MAPAELHAVAVRVLLLSLLAVSGTGSSSLPPLPVHGVATAVDAFVASWSLIALLFLFAGFFPVSFQLSWKALEFSSLPVKGDIA